jgi:putative SOS response-associated peptidase YedK
MCGRFSLTIAEQLTITIRFNLKRINYELKPRYNIAPTEEIPIIRNDLPDVLVGASWGLIPHWAKDEKMSFKMINARAETLTEKPAYKIPFEEKRCLVIADSYYEWKKQEKTPYRIMMKDEGLFAFAGLWDSWKGKVTCSIITTEPNELVKKLHIRMPAILPRESEQRWLEGSSDEARRMLRPFDSEKMKIYEISPLVNNVKNKEADVIKPVSRPDDLTKFMH